VEEKSTLDDVPTAPAAVSSRATRDDTRTRVLTEAKHFATWLSRHPWGSDLTRVEPGRLVISFIHERLRRAIVRPVRPVTRPSTPETWIRRLQAAFPSRLRRAEPAFTRYIKGLYALAPAPPLTERDVQPCWKAAQEDAFRKATRADSQMAAALWLIIAVQRKGLRPLPALRSVLPQAKRTWCDHELTVRVLIDKDNPVGRIPAPRTRTVRVPPQMQSLLRRHLPIPNDRATLTQLAAKRAKLLRKHGLRDARSARRDAGAAAHAEEMDVGAVLNHRPGSAATPRYANSTTPAATVRALAVWQ